MKKLLFFFLKSFTFLLAAMSAFVIVDNIFSKNQYSKYNVRYYSR